MTTKNILTALLVIAFTFLCVSNAQAQKYDKAGIKAAIVNAGVPESGVTQDMVDKYYNFCLQSMDNEDKFEKNILPTLKYEYERRKANEAEQKAAQEAAAQAYADSIKNAKYETTEWYRHPDFRAIVNNYFAENMQKQNNHSIIDHVFSTNKKEKKNERSCELCKNFYDGELNSLIKVYTGERSVNYGLLGKVMVVSAGLKMGNIDVIKGKKETAGNKDKSKREKFKEVDFNTISKIVECCNIGGFHLGQEGYGDNSFVKDKQECKKMLNNTCLPYVNAIWEEGVTKEKAYDIVKDGIVAMLDTLYSNYKKSIFEYFDVRERGNVIRLVSKGSDSFHSNVNDTIMIANGQIKEIKGSLRNYEIDAQKQLSVYRSSALIYKYMNSKQAEDFKQICHFWANDPHDLYGFRPFMDSDGNISYKNKRNYTILPNDQCVYLVGFNGNEDKYIYLKWLFTYENVKTRIRPISWEDNEKIFNNVYLICPSGNKYKLPILELSLIPQPCA